MKLSIIIPVLNEGKQINETLIDLTNTIKTIDYEIIVVDGHPELTTINQVNVENVVLCSSKKGRSIQMNEGAKHAKGELLLFLHSDTKLEKSAINSLIRLLDNNQNMAAGAFDLKINTKGLIFRIIEKIASIRSRLTKIPYGDQSIFIRKSVFKEIGCYPEIPIMEDVELMLNLKKRKQKIKILPEKSITSARRWKKEGILYTTLRNWTLIILYFIGIPPKKLKKYYK